MRNFVSCIFRRPLKKSSAFMRIYVSCKYAQYAQYVCAVCAFMFRILYKLVYFINLLSSFLLLSGVGLGAKKKTAKSGLNFGRLRLYHLTLAKFISPLLTSRLAVGVKNLICSPFPLVAKNGAICSLTLLRIKNFLKYLDNSIT